MVKKFLAMLLLATMVFSMTGCSITISDGKNDKEEITEDVSEEDENEDEVSGKKHKNDKDSLREELKKMEENHEIGERGEDELWIPVPKDELESIVVPEDDGWMELPTNFFMGMSMQSKEIIATCFCNDLTTFESNVNKNYNASVDLKDTVIYKYNDIVIEDATYLTEEELAVYQKDIPTMEDACLVNLTLPLEQIVPVEGVLMQYDVLDYYRVLFIKIGGRWYIGSMEETDAKAIGEGIPVATP
jgi:hypothetical protein